MKTKEHITRVRENVVEKCIAVLHYKNNIPTFECLTDQFII